MEGRHGQKQEVPHGPDHLFQPGGEPPIVSTGAVIANAIHDAVGVRVFDLPITPERVLEAFKKG
jgi:CO/xanthine dehydrogenase Mo-binding subunit